MIPNSTLVSEVQSNMTGRRIKVGLDPESLVHLMDAFSGVYSNTTEAVAREYVTNAIDSHLEAGVTRPVEVTLPSMWQPNLVVRDFGVGMDIERIEEVYANYGASTKRDNADANGMLGIGSKSAYAYSNSFIVTAVKDGKRNSLSFGRDDEGSPEIIVMEENSDTDENNGVTVTIPVSNTQEMINAVRRVCAVMPEGLVLVDGNDLSERANWTLVGQNIKDDSGEVVILNLWSLPNDVNGAITESRIIMGNVAYEPLWQNDYSITHHYRIVAEVAMGAVAFAPSREKLKESRLTTRTQELIRKKFFELLGQAIIDKISNAATHSEAMRVYHANESTLGYLDINSVKYKGEEVPGGLSPALVSSHDSDPAIREYFPGRGRSRYAVSRIQRVQYRTLVGPDAERRIVVGAPQDAPKTADRRRITQYFERENPPKHGYFGYSDTVLLLSEGLDPEKDKWLEDIKVHQWSDIAKEVLPRNPRGGGTGVRTKGKYHVLEDNGSLTLREIESKEKILYHANVRELQKSRKVISILGLNAWEKAEVLSVHRALNNARRGLPDDAVIVDVYANRMAKYEREYPHSVALTDDLLHDTLVAVYTREVTDDDIEAWAWFQTDTRYRQSLARFIPEDDPDREWFSQSPDRSGHWRVERAMRLAPVKNALQDKLDKAEQAAKVRMNGVIARYPLLSGAVGDEVYRRYFEYDWERHNNSKEK